MKFAHTCSLNIYANCRLEGEVLCEIVACNIPSLMRMDLILVDLPSYQRNVVCGLRSGVKTRAI